MSALPLSADSMHDAVWLGVLRQLQREDLCCALTVCKAWRPLAQMAVKRLAPANEAQLARAATFTQARYTFRSRLLRIAF